MECYAQLPLQRDEWELLYDHSQLCEALMQEGAPVAKALFAPVSYTHLTLPTT